MAYFERRRESSHGFVDPSDAPPSRFADARRSLSRQSSSTLTSLVRQSSSARERLVRSSSSASKTLRRRSSRAMEYIRKHMPRRESNNSAHGNPDAAEALRPLDERGHRKRVPANRAGQAYVPRHRRYTGHNVSAFGGFALEGDEEVGECWNDNPLRRSLSSRSVGSRSVSSRAEAKAQPSFRVSEHAVVSRHAKSLGVRQKRAARSSDAGGMGEEEEEEEEEEYMSAMREYMRKREARKSLYL